MIKTLVLFIFLSVLSSVTGECPANPDDDIPIMYDEDHFTCAKIWNGPGDSYWVDACNGCSGGTSFSIRDGYDQPGDVRMYYPMGSIMVKAGCTLFMYEDVCYDGELKQVEGPFEIYDNTWGTEEYYKPGCAKGPRSFKCRCIQKPVDCVAEDHYKEIFHCTNDDSDSTISCTYSKTVGTSYDPSLTDSMSIDASIETELSSQYFKLFSESPCVTTNYNWEHASAATRGELHTFEVSFDVEPGDSVTVQQVVGTCGGSTSRTDSVRQSKRKKDGTIITTDLESSPAAMSVKDERVKKWAIEDNEIGQFMNATSMLYAPNRDRKSGTKNVCGDDNNNNNGAKIEIPFFNFYFLNFVFLYLSILTIYHL